MAVLPLATSFAPLAVPSKAPAQRRCPLPAVLMGVVGDILGVTTKLMPAANKVEIVGGAPLTSTGANAETMMHWDLVRVSIMAMLLVPMIIVAMLLVPVS